MERIVNGELLIVNCEGGRKQRSGGEREQGRYVDVGLYESLSIVVDKAE
jgi:hypothetical protein